MHMKFHIKTFPAIITQTIHDDGILSILEVGKQLPFIVKRIYTIDKCIPNLDRGHHAHKKTRQAIFCLRGSIDLELDNGVIKTTKHLDNPNIGMLIEPKIWHDMRNISQDALMLVLADKNYDEDDYIRNYPNFLEYIQKDMK